MSPLSTVLPINACHCWLHSLIIFSENFWNETKNIVYICAANNSQLYYAWVFGVLSYGLLFGVSISPVSIIFRLDFGTVPIAWYFIYCFSYSFFFFKDCYLVENWIQWNLSKLNPFQTKTFVWNRQVFGLDRLNSLKFSILGLNLMFSLHRILVYPGFGIDRFHCTNISKCHIQYC
jgi:hypothetical protein